MCLSPEVDIAAASVITVFAFDAIKHNQHARSLPIALVPAIFAIHTFSDAFVWLADRGNASQTLGNFSAQTYLFIAFVLLPIFVPLATNLIEPKGWRKNLIGVIAFGGLLSGLDAAISMLQNKTTVTVCDYYIDYHVQGTTSAAGFFYMVATCGAMLLSGEKILFRWGIVNVVVVLVLGIFANHQLPSLWCFWAAITSFFVTFYIRHLEKITKTGKKLPWQRKEEFSEELEAAT